ncbi:MAG: hypothetical protein WC008_02275 [Bacilli bacterium]
MDSYTTRKQKFKDKYKKSLIKNLLSSFVMTTVVVVIAVAVTSRTPTAQIINTEVFGNDIFYDVNIVDNDYAILENSLRIIAKSQTKNHMKSLSVGRMQGSFGQLEPNTIYDIQIVAKYGYGEGVLAKTTVKTEENYGGRIINWEFVKPDEQME